MQEEQPGSPMGNSGMPSSPISEMTNVTDGEQSNDAGDEMDSERIPETESEERPVVEAEEERMEIKETPIVNKKASQMISASYPKLGQKVVVRKERSDRMG